ncbi:DUF3429 domain-containing protein [Phenylobacterium sp.]|uniref:DUF3429 domain-containing protein n=1 Tax=Phenylobacterium sp. TaxID=1871053 RepID=UPI00391C7257
MDDVRSGTRIESAPRPLWVIALIALLPFPAAALVYCYGPAAYARPALTTLLTWAAVIVAFLGGVRWGLETRERRPRWRRLAFSALSAAAAWAVFLGRGRLSDAWILGGFIAVFLVQWLFDHQTPDTPSRYPTLSTALTAGACISLALALEKTINA